MTVFLVGWAAAVLQSCAGGGSPAAGAGPSAGPTAWVQVGAGAWSQTSTVSLAAGTSLVLGPRPESGGAWSWSGCGTSGTAREQTLTARATCTATAVYTAPDGTRTSVPFTITVPGMRDLTSLALSQQMGAGWNLGNSLEAIGGETAWGNPPVTQAFMDAVKAAGFKTVRIPVSWAQYADANDDIDPAWMARVTQVVGYAQQAGLYAIVDIHWDGGWMVPTYAQQATVNARLTKFWTQIASNFKDHDDTLLFAGTNEVHVEGQYGPPTAENYTVQNGFNQVFVNAVRATGGNNLARHLVVQGYNTNIDDTVSVATVPTDPMPDRLMMEVHFYDPYDFTLNASSAIWQWGAGATDPSATETWANEAYVDAQFAKMKVAFVDRGIPVVLGEYGAIRRTEYPGAEAYRTAWDAYVAHSAWSQGAVPIYWDAGAPTENHSTGLFDRTTGAQVYPDLIGALVDAAR
jgi:endoglucanase